eukprot:353394-Chlamydomonas_euryale.AAC.12
MPHACTCNPLAATEPAGGARAGAPHPAMDVLPARVYLRGTCGSKQGGACAVRAFHHHRRPAQPVMRTFHVHT